MSTTIHTIERRPKAAGAGPAPLLLLLHGYGSNERDLFDLAGYLDPRLHIVSARAPLALDWGGFAWYNLGGAPGRLIPDAAGRDRAIETLAKFVAALPGRLGSDPQRTYLLGFSQGAIISLGLAWRAPAHIAGVVAVSGYLDPEVAAGAPEAGLAGLPILQIHGAYDDVIPVGAAHLTRDALAATPARHEYHEHPVGHSIHPDGMRAIQSWIAARLAEPERDE